MSTTPVGLGQGLFILPQSYGTVDETVLPDSVTGADPVGSSTDLGVLDAYSQAVDEPMSLPTDTGAAGILPGDDPLPSPSSVDQLKLLDLKERIEQGVRSGELTPEEAKALLAKLEKLEKMAGSVMKPAARAAFEKQLALLSKDVYAQKHDPERTGAGWDNAVTRLEERIKQGVESGELTAAEAKKLSDQLAAYKDAIAKAQAASPDGTISPQDAAALREQEKKLSQQIYELKHNGDRGANARSWEQRVDDFQKRIDQGVQSGELTAEEAKALQEKLDAFKKDLAAATGPDGKVDPAKADALAKQEAQLSKEIYQQKHDGERGPDARGWDQRVTDFQSRIKQGVLSGRLSGAESDVATGLLDDFQAGLASAMADGKVDAKEAQLLARLERRLDQYLNHHLDPPRPQPEPLPVPL